MMKRSSWVFLGALFLLIGVCAAQAPPPSPDCSAALVSLLPCLDYVQGNVSTPPQNCCVGLSSVVQNTPSCLCLLFNSSALPIQVNTTRALQLPSICKVATPDPSSICGAGVVPVAGPVSSPPVSAPAPPAASPTLAPSTGTPPLAAATPPAATTPAVAPATPMAPTVAPSTPTTPSIAPSIVPSVAPLSSPPAPTLAPTAEVPASSPSTLVPSSIATPPAPATMTPLPSLSSPPSPPPADQNSAMAILASSLMSGVAVLVSGFLFLQL